MEIIHLPFTGIVTDPPVDYYKAKAWTDATRDDSLDSTVGASATEFTFSVAPGHTYSFTICAVRDAIEGPESSPVSIIVPDPSLTAPAPGTPYIE